MATPDDDTVITIPYLVWSPQEQEQIQQRPSSTLDELPNKIWFPDSVGSTQPMHISSRPRDREAQSIRARDWLLGVLNQPTLSGNGRSYPASLNTVIYIDETPRYVSNGYWAIASTGIQLPTEAGNVSPLERLTILAALASVHGATAFPEVTSKIIERLVDTMRTTTLSVYENLIDATARPSRIAINERTFQVAAELEGHWILTSGAPIEVDDSWIIMDF